MGTGVWGGTNITGGVGSTLGVSRRERDSRGAGCVCHLQGRAPAGHKGRRIPPGSCRSAAGPHRRSSCEGATVTPLPPAGVAQGDWGTLGRDWGAAGGNGRQWRKIGGHGSGAGGEWDGIGGYWDGTGGYQGVLGWHWGIVGGTGMGLGEGHSLPVVDAGVLHQVLRRHFHQGLGRGGRG